MAEKDTFVRCMVSPGLFDGEYYVIVANASAYVAKRKVVVQKEPEPSGEGRQVNGDVKVFVVEGDPLNNRALVELPGEPAAGGLRTWVSQEQLSLR